MVQLRTDGFFVNFVVGKCQTDLVQRIAVERIVVNAAQYPRLVNGRNIAGYAVNPRKQTKFVAEVLRQVQRPAVGRSLLFFHAWHVVQQNGVLSGTQPFDCRRVGN